MGTWRTLNFILSKWLLIQCTSMQNGVPRWFLFSHIKKCFQIETNFFCVSLMVSVLLFLLIKSLLNLIK